MSLNKFIAICLLLAAAIPVHSAEPPAPVAAPAPPAWVAGYRVRFPLRPAVDFATEKVPTESVVARLPAAGYLRADGSDICVQTQDGELIPVCVLSHNPAGDTLIQFKRRGNDPTYWAYAGNPSAPAANAPPIPEGTSVEFRDWQGDSLATWADVVAGLQKSRTVSANAFVDMVAQNVNPGRPDTNRNFTASYRGSLRIADEDVYKFYVGSEDAVFLFIDGERVFEAKGSRHFSIRFPANEWVEVHLTAGVHPFEIHHVCGADALAAHCSFYMKTDGPKKKSANFVPQEMYTRATLAEAAAIEAEKGAPAATFGWGIDDTLSTPGITFHLARFEAQGTVPEPAQIQWDFGDGTRGTGRSPMHVYLKSGEYQVTMNAGANVPPISQRVYMWTAPSPTSPFSLAKAVELLTTSDWSGWDTQRVNSLFDFLTVSEQPNRWPLVEKIGRHLLKQPDLDLKRRVTLQTNLMEALAEQGRGTEALQLMQEALTAAGKLPSLKVLALLAGADIQWIYLKDYTAAAQLYEKIINENRGLDLPLVREAAIHWGDLFTEAGDMVQAEERYRLAKTLGGERFASTGQTEAIQRGAQLRIAEQKLRSGDVRGTRLLLERIEMEFPEQKLEGMYCFLRAETDRFAGRYEDSIRHYEVLLKLRQWAGFRDRAIHGLADCYFREEEFAKSLEWFDRLRDSFPEYFDAQKLASVYELAKAGAERLAAAQKTGTPAESKGFRGYATAFEPDEKEPPATMQKIVIAPLLGIDRPNVAAISNGSHFWTKELQNLQAGGNVWVEFWYREQMQARDVTSWGNALVNFYSGTGANMSKDPYDHLTISLTRTYGQWRKAAVLVRTPMSQDGTFKLTFVNAYGTMRVDGLKILPVTDRQLDSRRSFIEAPEIE